MASGSTCFRLLSWAPLRALSGIGSPRLLPSTTMRLQAACLGIKGESQAAHGSLLPSHSPPLKPLLCSRQQTVLEVPQGQDRAPGIMEWPLVKNTPRNYRLGKLPCRDRVGHCAGRSQGGQGRPLREGHPKIVCQDAINRPQCKAKQRRKQKRTQISIGNCC